MERSAFAQKLLDEQELSMSIMDMCRDEISDFAEEIKHECLCEYNYFGEGVKDIELNYTEILPCYVIFKIIY